MATNSLRRNDQCRCGSGKKYKNCCLHRNCSPSPPRTAPNAVPPGEVESGEPFVISSTAEHPFYVYQKGWTPLAQIKPGDWIRTDNGWVEVNRVEDTGEFETVYNLRVADHHTYFVASPDGSYSVWAHNQYSPQIVQFRNTHDMNGEGAGSNVVAYARRIVGGVETGNPVYGVNSPNATGRNLGQFQLPEAAFTAIRDFMTTDNRRRVNIGGNQVNLFYSQLEFGRQDF